MAGAPLRVVMKSGGCQENWASYRTRYRVPFREAYPDFTKWVDSKGASNQKWYENFVDEKTIRYW